MEEIIKKESERMWSDLTFSTLITASEGNLGFQGKYIYFDENISIYLL